MSEKIKVGIVGYGNLGKGTQLAVGQAEDMELVGIFTRRDPASLDAKGAKVFSTGDAPSMRDKIDVLILCGGSATDLEVQGPHFAAMFNTIDSFDTHARIPEYFASVDRAARENNNTSIISVGWDPGLFSLNRLYAESILTNGETYTFWGKGVSQGHSDAVRRVEGIKNAIQYTVPVESAMDRVRNGENPALTTREKHLRECYVVAQDGADKALIEKKIKTMPNYFDEYDTVVNFISEEEFNKTHNKMPHGGFVIRSGETNSGKNKHIIEYSLKLDSNPEFTSSVLTAYARAAVRLANKGDYGAKTVFDIAPALLSPNNGEELRKKLL